MYRGLPFARPPLRRRRLAAVGNTCHNLPPSEIDGGLFLQAQKGDTYFTELAERVEYGKYVGGAPRAERLRVTIGIVDIFCPFGQFCEINISLLSLQKQPNTAPNLFQRGVEYGKYAGGAPRAERLRVTIGYVML